MQAQTRQRKFESGADLFDVTSMHRPDTAWRFIDAHGHEHCWYLNGERATAYKPDASYDVPTLVWIKDGEEYWADADEPHDVGHYECRHCGEHVERGFKADDHAQYVQGLRWYQINGQTVTPEEFEREWLIDAKLRADEQASRGRPASGTGRDNRR